MSGTARIVYRKCCLAVSEIHILNIEIGVECLHGVVAVIRECAHADRVNRARRGIYISRRSTDFIGNGGISRCKIVLAEIKIKCGQKLIADLREIRKICRHTDKAVAVDLKRHGIVIESRVALNSSFDNDVVICTRLAKQVIMDRRDQTRKRRRQRNYSPFGTAGLQEGVIVDVEDTRAVIAR